MTNLLKSGPNKGKLFFTEDYSIFKLSGDNRDVQKSLQHVKRLKIKLEQYNDLHLHPIICNSNMEIVDGQFRFTAAKELGLGVYYVIDDNYHPEKMIIYNTTQKSWDLDDFLNYWTHHGKDDYINLKRFLEDIGFSLTITVQWLEKSKNKRIFANFKNGSFKFNVDKETLLAMKNTVKFIEFLKDKNFKPISMFSQSSFHTACKRFFTNPLVDTDRFFEKLQFVPFSIRYERSWTDYLDQLVEIYNWKNRKDNLKLVSDGKDKEISR